MIVSRLHRFIFAAVPKTGTHAVRRALREHLGPDDIEQVSLYVHKKFPMPELARISHGHISLEQVRPHLGAADFDSYFKFAFVRNPFDRFVSYCAFMTRTKREFDTDPRAVMRHFALTAPPFHHILFQPQISFVAGGDGQLLADAIGRVETMQASYDEICRKIGIPTAPLESVNRSERGDYRQYYDRDLIDAVAKLYARDLDTFGYEF